jgi:hypothetical protein
MKKSELRKLIREELLNEINSYKHIDTGERTINKKVKRKIRELFPKAKKVEKINVAGIGETHYIKDSNNNNIGFVFKNKKTGNIQIDIIE